MTDVNAATEVAKGLSDYGMMVMTTSFFLLLSAAMMITIFKWFKSIVNQMIQDAKEVSEKQNECWQQLLAETQSQNEKLNGLLESLRPDTILKVHTFLDMAFDLAIERVCRIIKKVREENHIIDHEATEAKIRMLLQNLYDSHKGKFDVITYEGKKLSEHFNERWIDDVTEVVKNEIYNEQGPNNGRAYTNVKMIYDKMKIEMLTKMS